MIDRDVTIWVAFISGLASFLSPCLLPMIPGYIAFMAGEVAAENDQIDRRIAITRTLLFILGFTLIFLTMGLSASAIGGLFASNKKLLQQLAGVVIALMGLQLTGVLKIPALGMQRGINVSNTANRWFKPLLMGLAFGAGWTPCFGPILAAILVMASAAETVFKGTMMLFVYALGLGVPFFLTAVFINEAAAVFAGIDKAGVWLKRITGIILIGFGILMATNQLVRLNLWF